jgi:hypothetical protein
MRSWVCATAGRDIDIAIAKTQEDHSLRTIIDASRKLPAPANLLFWFWILLALSVGQIKVGRGGPVGVLS